jgi:hypothetical protein
MKATAADVRKWARKVGIPVGDRGPIDQLTWADYLDRHPEASN